MKRINIKLDCQMIDLLKKMVGQKMHKFTRDLLSVSLSPFGSVSIFCDKNIVEIKNDLQVLTIDHPNDYGVLSVCEIKDESEIKEMYSRPSENLVQAEIRDIKIVTDTISCFLEQTGNYEVKFDVAIIFDMRESSIVLEKDIWFSEDIIVHSNTNNEKVLKPIDNGWKFKKPYKGVYKREMVSVLTL